MKLVEPDEDLRERKDITPSELDLLILRVQEADWVETEITASLQVLSAYDELFLEKELNESKVRGELLTRVLNYISQVHPDAFTRITH